MKAAVLTDYGDVDKFDLRDIVEPSVPAGSLKVRLAGASVNMIDWKLRRGYVKQWMPIEFPHVLGRDASGVVVQVGTSGSSGSPFKVGDRVLGFLTQTYAEFAVAPETAWALVPAGLDLADAAALPLVVLTGAQLIEEAVRPQKGQLLLVTGALGAVGRAAVWAAQKAGARVVAGVRKKQLGDAATLGAESVVALDDPDAVEAIGPIDAIADTVGGETVTRLITKVKPGGTVGSVVGEPAGAKDRGLVVHSFLTHPDSKRLAALAQAVAAGDLIIPIAARFPLAQVKEAHQLAEKGAPGKVLLTLS